MGLPGNPGFCSMAKQGQKDVGGICAHPVMLRLSKSIGLTAFCNNLMAFPFFFFGGVSIGIETASSDLRRRYCFIVPINSWFLEQTTCCQ